MSKTIQPSKFHFVKSSTTIRSCLMIMKEKNLSFLLIEGRGGDLVGIFTLKDLLKNWQYLTTEAQLDKSIRVVMTKPVLTLPSHRVHKAESFMVKNQIRHLPITTKNAKGHLRVEGVVDMESILKSDLLDEEILVKKSRNISVYSPTGALLKFVKNTMKKYALISVDKFWASKMKNPEYIRRHVKKYNILVFDIVDRKSLHLAMKVQREIEGSKKRLVGVVAPNTFGVDIDLDELDWLAQKKNVKIFFKPFNVHDFIIECLT